MIQRKQSLYLLASFLIIGMLLFMKLGILAGTAGVFELRFYGLVDVTNAENEQLFIRIWALAAMVVLPIVLSFLSIFMYRNRKLQMRITGINIGIMIGLSILMVVANYMLASDLDFDWHFDYSMLLPLIAAVFSYLAYRGISDDEALINSLNRLR